MEIKDFKDLNALNKLLFKVKFSEDISFEELQIFAGSSIISDLMIKMHGEYLSLHNNLGITPKHVAEPLAKDNPEITRIVKKRISISGIKGVNRLVNTNNLDEYIRNLYAPYVLDEKTLEEVKKYALNLQYIKK